MSCISFLSPTQRAQLRASSRDDGRPLSRFASPEASEGKVRRVRMLALSADPKIRESAALSQWAPADVLEALAADAQAGVRCCVARNYRTAPAVLTRLSRDPADVVRGWVAAHPAASDAVLSALENDADENVRKVVTWARAWPEVNPVNAAAR